MQTTARLLFVILVLVTSDNAFAVGAEWNSNDGNWNNPFSWLPNDVPDNGGGITYDVQIGNRPLANGAGVTFIPEDGTSDTVTTLSITDEADLFTNGFQLNVLAQTTLTGTGSTLRIDPHNTPGVAAFQTVGLTLNSGGVLVMNGGIVIASGLTEINFGTNLQGRGQINAGDLDATAEQAFENSGLIQLSGTSSEPGTLTLHANGVDTLDLDGDSEGGVVDVSNATGDLELDSLTLIVDGPLADAFNSTLQIGQRDTVIFNRDYTLNGATVQMTGGAFSATLGGPGAAALITSSSFTISGNAVFDSDLTFSGTTNTITLSPLASLTIGPDATVSLPHSAALVFGNGGQLIVNGELFIDDYTTNFDWDGPSNNVVTTVGASGFLNMKSQHINGGNNVFSSTINLQGGILGVHPSAPGDWTMAGTLNNTGGASNIHGLSNITGTVNVTQGYLTFHFDTTLGNGSHFNIASGAFADTDATTFAAGSNANIDGRLRLVGGSTTFAGPATLGGTGELWFASNSTVTANTTINTTSFDWDGSVVGLTHTINSGVVLTINSTIWDADEVSPDVDANVTLAGNNSQLLVNGVAEWRLNGTLTANAAAAGTATIGGPSRLIVGGTMNVDGNTNVLAPITFAPGSMTDVDGLAMLTLNGAAAYDDGTITGPGNFFPSILTNEVVSDFTISTSSFYFDRGSWVISPGATLSVDVNDYSPLAVTNEFHSAIGLNGGTAIVTTGDAEFVMNGTMTMNTFPGAVHWAGEPLDIGNDVGALDANLNVNGGGLAVISAPIDFNSDADVDIAANTELVLTNIVNFDTVNGGNQAEFTGAGELFFSGEVNVNEAVTLNMVGGTVDLDGNDTFGDFIDIDAPITINAAHVSSFGRVNSGGGVNTLDINNNAGTGVLTVNLDGPGAEWTLNVQGTLNLVNDNTPATLLAGSPVNLNAQVNVTGDVRVDARLDIGNPTISIQTAGEPLRLSGGTLADPNTIAGAAVNGPGILGADDATALDGTGTINANVDFDGTARLRADNGILSINGVVVDVGTLGTADSDGILNVTNAWSTSVADNVILLGGELRGGIITNDGANGVSGSGLLSARIINNTRITQTGASSTLVVATGANDNDWDGALNSGTLEAVGSAGTLELRDNAPVQFGGTMRATNSTVFINGFEFDFQPGSLLKLTAGTIMAGTARLGGAVNVAAGGDSTIDITLGGVLDFQATSLTSLTGNLWLTHNSIVRNGATFSGLGALGVSLGGTLTPENGADIDVLVVNDGRFRIADSGVGRVDAKDYQQANSGRMLFDFSGPGLAQFDRFVVSGAVQLAGTLETAITGGYVPPIGESFTIISATGGVSGTFDTVLKPAGIAANQKLEVNYAANLVQVTVVADTYWPWVTSFADVVALGSHALEKGADPDFDGIPNIGEFALDGNPGSGLSLGKMVAKIAPVGGVNAFTLTFPVRAGAVLAATDPAGGPLLLEQTIDDLSYSIESSDELGVWTLDVSEVTGGDAVAIQAKLPPVSPGWVYRTFRSPGPVAGDNVEFMRVVVANTE